MKAAGSTPPASASSPPAANGTSRPGPTPAASSPPPGRTCRCPQSPRKPSPERRFPPAGSGVSTRKNPTNDSLPQTPMRQSSREPDSIGYTALNKGNVNGYVSSARHRRISCKYREIGSQISRPRADCILPNSQIGLQDELQRRALGPPQSRQTKSCNKAYAQAEPL